VLDYSFGNLEYLATALTHPSAVGTGGGADYERLEFLGDAVLDLAIADLLMRRLPDAREGTLSKHRASIVNGRTLAAKAQSVGIGTMLRLGKGEEKSGGRHKTSILAAAFEAVIGAIYTDGGLAPAQRVVEQVFEVADRKWRGIGTIPMSGLRLREEFAAYDSEKIFGVNELEAAEPPECISAQVLQGLKKPVDCPAFATRCTPETPLGAPMVSAEGACAAYYQYRRHAASLVCIA